VASVDDFLTLLPQFDGAVSTDTIDKWLTVAARTVDTDFGADQDEGQIYLAAHLMSVAGIGPQKGAAGLAPLSSFRSGSVSMTKDKDKRGDFALTSFGRLFWDMWVGAKGSGIAVMPTGDYPWPYGSGGWGDEGYPDAL
jgi:hypothetical protein